MATDAEKYEAASLLERVAIGDEGEQREKNRALILQNSDAIRGVAGAALITAASSFVDAYSLVLVPEFCHRAENLRDVLKAIELLGLEIT